MPGGFSKATRPLRPGAYFNWVASQPPQVQPAVGGIVAIPATHDWGPFKTAVLVESYQEYQSYFGASLQTPLARAVWLAFQGERGFDGRYGAGGVLVYRSGSSAAAKGTRVLNNSSAAAAMTVSARYEGSFGNTISLTTQDNIADATKNQLLVYVGATLVETYTYLDTDISALVADINLNSDWITATLTTTGVALAAVTTQALSGGNDGTTTIASDWTSAGGILERLEAQRFAILVPYGLTDAPTLASIKAWAAGAETVGSTGLNTKGKRFEVVTGGAANETNATAITRSGTLNDGNFTNLGQSSFSDSLYPDAAGNPTVFAPAEFAAAWAGALAGRGEAMAMTYVRFPGVDLLNGPTESEILKALAGGVVVFSKDSDPDAPMHGEKAVTTYTSTAQAAFPYVIYRNPKFMRTMQAVEVEFTDWAGRNMIGTRVVNNKTRDSAVAEIQRRLRLREAANIIQSGWSVAVDDNPPPSDDDEFIALKVGIKFGRSVEQVYFTVNVG